MLNVSVSLSPETQRLNYILLTFLMADEVHCNNLLKAIVVA